LDTRDVLAQFRKHFQGDAIVITAPGRINLIGEHTDYNGGFVLPAATDKHFVFAMAPNGSDNVNCIALDLNERESFNLGDLKPGNGWVNYLMGVLQGLRNLGVNIGGVDCVFSSSIPSGAGLSSSAALCCGFGFGIGELFDKTLSRLSLAKVAQYAEHQFAGVMCGIMDQYASLFGEKDCALLLDCQKLEHQAVPVHHDEYSILMIDTKVKHSLASTAYNDRRASCEEAVALIGRKYPTVKSLRNVTHVMLAELQDQLGEDTFIKAKYVVDEIARTIAAAEFLRSNQIEKFGDLMFQTHWGLSRMYDVSCEELDRLVHWAEDHRSMVCGARMMGGGFGGCTINLVRSDKVNYLRGYVAEKYFATFGSEPDFFTVDLSQGVHRSGA
jgi:galactokinase